MKNLQHITLVSFGGFERKFQQRIADSLSSILKCDVILRDEHIDLNQFFDPTRRQYNGDLILREVDSIISGSSKVIGIFNVDLFIPILTFIYGQAMLNGRTAVVSVYRLDNQHYGLRRDPDLFFQRIIKEIIHELGHTLGLIHCYAPNCVMRSSTYVEDIDQKKATFCRTCEDQLNNHFSSLS